MCTARFYCLATTRFDLRVSKRFLRCALRLVPRKCIADSDRTIKTFLSILVIYDKFSFCYFAALAIADAQQRPING